MKRILETHTQISYLRAICGSWLHNCLRAVWRGGGIVMRIKLHGFGGHGWRVCDTCPCNHEWGCYFTYTQQPGQMKLATGKVFPYDGPAKQSGRTVAAGWYYVTIRPQECIDKHGK